MRQMLYLLLLLHQLEISIALAHKNHLSPSGGLTCRTRGFENFRKRESLWSHQKSHTNTKMSMDQCFFTKSHITWNEFFFYATFPLLHEVANFNISDFFRWSYNRGNVKRNSPYSNLAKHYHAWVVSGNIRRFTSSCAPWFFRCESLLFLWRSKQERNTSHD